RVRAVQRHAADPTGRAADAAPPAPLRQRL
ncbi:MAG: hypothetical protein AVDCRST_MAG40-742, partial [uncultured Gemmatimonadaceae bacterium]